MLLWEINTYFTALPKRAFYIIKEVFYNMATKTLNTRIQSRIDTYENWMKSELILLKGEIAICTIPTGTSDSGSANLPSTMLRIGDGVHKFSELPWFQAIAADIYPWAKAAVPAIPVENITGLDDHISKVAVDSDTQYTLIKGDNDYTYKLMSKAKGAENFTTEVATLTIPNPTSNINALKALVGDVAVATQISNAIAALKLSETYEAKGAAAAVQTALLGDAAEAYNTLGKLEDAVIAAKASADEKTTMAAVEAKNYATKTEAQGYATAVVGEDTDNAEKATVKGAKAYAKDLNDTTNTRVEALETAIGEGGSVSSQIDAKIANLDVAEVAVGTGEIIEKISETDGKISVSKRALVASDIPTIEQSQVNGLGAALAAKQDTLAFQNDNYDKTTNKAITKSDLDAAVAGLTGITHFKGVVENLPASAENGDIYIKTDGTEHIYVKPDAATEGHFEELGDQSSHIKHGTVVDSDIAANAAIAQSKIAGLTDALNAKANSADLGTMASETAADYIKKTDAPGYADILTATVAGTTYETKTDASAKLNEAKTYTTTELGKLNLTEVSAGEGKIISKISQVNGKVSAETRDLVAADIPTIEQSQVNGLDTALAAKANDADLAAIAKSGNVNDLQQTEGDTLIIFGGTSTLVI